MLARRFVRLLREPLEHVIPSPIAYRTSPPVMQAPPKVLITKIGLDGHDRGSRIVAAHLRDAGMEVVYTPPWQEIATVVKLALEEDVDVIGVSSLATDHLIVPKLMDALREAGLDDIAVIVGGIVPDEDERMLLDAGVARVFHPARRSTRSSRYVDRRHRARARRALPRLTGRRAMNKPLPDPIPASTDEAQVRWPPSTRRRSAPTRRCATAPASR